MLYPAPAIPPKSKSLPRNPSSIFATKDLPHYSVPKMSALNMTKEAFTVFDPDNTNSIDIKDVGSVLRSLAINPSRAELTQMLKEMTNGDETVQRISFDKLQEVVIPLITEKKMPRHNHALILKAFQTIDMERKGYIDPEKLAGMLTTLGEPFSQEEIEDMFAVAVDSDKGVIMYEEFSLLLAHD